MNEGQLTRALAAGNAWWRDPEWERKDRDLRALAATTLDYAPSPLSDVVPDGLYVLRGPRRVGKSLEIKRAISRLVHSGVEPRSIIHFACDELGRGEGPSLRQNDVSCARCQPRWILRVVGA